MQIKVRYHCTLTRLSKFKNSENIKSRWKGTKGRDKPCLLEDVLIGTSTTLESSLALPSFIHMHAMMH